jgi:hypothetical protein
MSAKRNWFVWVIGISLVHYAMYVCMYFTLKTKFDIVFLDHLRSWFSMFWYACSWMHSAFGAICIFRLGQYILTLLRLKRHVATPGSPGVRVINSFYQGSHAHSWYGVWPGICMHSAIWSHLIWFALFNNLAKHEHSWMQSS